MLKICVLDQNVKGKKKGSTFLKLFLNAMIRNIKIHNNFYIMEISRSMKLNKIYSKRNF